MYWKLFNFLGRLFGWGALITGSLIFLSSIPNLIDPEGTVVVNGVEESDLFYRLFSVLFPLLIAIVGGLMIKAKPFYPFGKPKNYD